MGYELNTKAYSLFIQIEVGLREFLIELIKQNGIQEWFKEFLGGIQRDSINEISKRLNDAKNNQILPEIEDLYMYKANRALKTKEASFFSNRLFHPFYYLNWPDLENLMRMKSNSNLIDKTIGKQNRKAIVELLNMLISLRNDIAHSRFINDDDFRIIKGAFDQITSLIPNFNSYTNSQTTEDTLDITISKVSDFVELIKSTDLLSNDKIDEIMYLLESCLNSFWLNSIANLLLAELRNLKAFMVNYKAYRKSRGGLYKIIKLKELNFTLFTKIQIQIKNGEI